MSKITLEEVLKRQELYEELEKNLLSKLMSEHKEYMDLEMAKIKAEFLDAIKFLKGEKGDSVKGDKGDPPTPEELTNLIKPLIPKIRDGNDGHTPTYAELLSLIKPLIPKVEDGKTPIKGVDYRDGEDAPTLQEVIDSIMPKIKETLPELVEKHAPQKNYSLIPKRSNAYFKPLTITGTKNGTNKEFYLSEAPLYGSQVFVFLNGQWLSPDDWTLSGVTLTLGSATPAPLNNWNLYALAFKP